MKPSENGNFSITDFHSQVGRDSLANRFGFLGDRLRIAHSFVAVKKAFQPLHQLWVLATNLINSTLLETQKT